MALPAGSRACRPSPVPPSAAAGPSG